MTAAATRWGLLARMDVRRERVIVPATVVLFAVINLSTAATIQNLASDPAQEQALRLTAGTNAAFRFLLGAVPDADSLAALASWRAGLFMVASLGVCAAMAVVRLTRKEEEAGRTELTLAGAVGPVAPAVAAVTVVIGFVIAVSAAMALTLLSVDGADAMSLIAVFAQYLSTGLAAIGLAVVAAEVFPSAHSANLAASTVVLVGYVLRGVADTVDGASWLRWTSPVGWAEAVEPFDSNNLWPASASLVVFAAGLAFAPVVRRRRDLGSGVLAVRPGPATGPGLRSPLVLVWRQSRSIVFSWAGGIAAYGVIIGVVTNQVESLAGSNKAMTDFLESSGAGGTLTQIFLSTMTAFLAVAAVGAGVSLVIRWRSEETSGRLEVLLATPVSRRRYFWTQSSMVGGAIVAVMIAAPTSILVGAGLAGAGWGSTARTVFGMAAASLPAAAATIALAVLLYAIDGRLAIVGWPLLVASWLLGPFGGMLGLPQWVRDISPFTHVPMIPLQAVQAMPLVIPALVAVVFAVGAAYLWERRDLG
ncbi:ABC transporter permease [Gordonia neofelifaecis]|uniref:Putative exporter of polyketide antibiotics-like protein n=1 Tax=Gordonia neofelifaecis NRRL B-59395 TaxID=644548 RepID=F1YLW5_9ACTN|nr:exporter of polyketide antibiotics- like protein [Gordonia neofelifaecis]EGD54216.1 Putative exporter of polyketide antibiotics- like protein [Gordonia neofelifaecis NRRL B-59395]